MSKSREELCKIAAEKAVATVNKVFESPEFQNVGNADDKVGLDIMSPSMASAVAEGVVGGIVGGIVSDMIPGPAIPG